MTPPVERSRAARALATLAAAAEVFVLVAVVVRLTVRDRYPILSVLFYATPWSLDAAGALFVAVVSWRLGRRRTAAVATAVAAGCAAFFVAQSCHWNDAPRPGALRGVHWNVAHGARGWSAVAAELAALRPDVAWLSESDDPDAPSAPDDALRAAFPGRALVRATRGLAIVARGEATYGESAHLASASRLERARLVVDGRAFESVQLDVASSPLVVRTPAFARTLRYVEPLLGAPLLVVGDFNTPRDSVGFDAWRGPLKHAFETTGRGLDATWPVPMPVLSIDHVWAGGGLVVRTCELPWTWRSDHLPVVFTFDVP